MSRHVLNLVNFVRGCEPRKPMDLYTPVRQEIAVNRAAVQEYLEAAARYREVPDAR